MRKVVVRDIEPEDRSVFWVRFLEGGGIVMKAWSLDSWRVVNEGIGMPLPSEFVRDVPDLTLP